jgi:hypothetical protein
MRLDQYLSTDLNRMSPRGQSSVQVNDELYPLVSAGDEAAIIQMIELNMSLVVAKVAAYIRCYPFAAYLQDELLSEGFVGLTKGVRKMAEDGPIFNPKPTRYMEYWILCHVGAVIDREDANGESDRLKRLRRQQEKNNPGESEQIRLRRVPLPDSMANSSHADELVDPMAMPDLRDLIAACCETDIDRIIVDMREKGYKDAEIAKVIETPYSTTYMLRRAIYRRVLDKSGMKGEA